MVQFEAGNCCHDGTVGIHLEREGSPQGFFLRFIFTASDLGKTIASQSSRPRIWSGLPGVVTLSGAL